jgi:hypothetical protein
MSYLVFDDRGESPSGKTRRWIVKNRYDNVLGWVDWKATWRKYTFSPCNQTTFDAACLRDLAELLEQEMAKR